ncbi:hypothetical protein [Bradyrhizobium sp.]|uniref:hypothetical protein n=1 Tax=Bradyrhizobium sp. TaxID=376 RepID=UPI0025C185AD|nr:hypothetical protein [Bradyrhizobium sp.]
MTSATRFSAWADPQASQVVKINKAKSRSARIKILDRDSNILAGGSLNTIVLP